MARNNKILLLEDEAVLGQIYSRHLEKAGFKVSWARDTNSAAALADKDDFDIAVLDQGIRDEAQSGLDLIPILKKNHPKTVIAILSNFSDFQIEKKAIGAGADAFWLKLNTPPPFLIQLVHELLLKKNGE
jgi:two-component system chemotaxis response regulator CheY